MHGDPSTRCRRSRARRGTATVEAVLLLPVLTVVLCGLWFVHARADAHQRARALARRCAWAHAVAGCGERPDGCDDTRHGVTAATPSAADTTVDDTAHDVRADVENDPLLSDVRLLGTALDNLWGTATQFTTDIDVARAGFTATATGHVYLLCNARPTTPWDAVRDTFCETTDLCP